MTPARRLALIAVANGAVQIDEQGCRAYPSPVSGSALTSAYMHGLWRWPTAEPVAGDVALVTPEGQQALAAQ